VEARATTPAAPAATAKPNGPVAAVLLATGIGSLVLAILVVWASASESFADSLAYDLEVGSLSGKTLWATAAFLVSWAVLGTVLRRREVDLRKVALVSAVLVGLGLIGTFSPFFELFAPEE
jgi:hypothetical protein